MGCPFHQGGSESDANETEPESKPDRPTNRSRGIDRRTFVKSALSIGGIGALTQLETVAGMAPNTREGGDQISAGTRLNRQHAWDAFEPVGGTLNTVPPHNSLFLCLDYRHDGEPKPGHRKQVEAALAEIERQFEWNANGVLFTMGYSASYFDRFDEDLPDGATPLAPEEVAEYSEMVTTDDVVEPDEHDAVLLLASGNAANLLAVEEALWGGDNALDVDFDATFEGVFEKPREFPHRRVGFIGSELPREEYDEKVDVEVPDESPLSMGFVAGFDASIPDEEIVTLKRDQRFPGPDVDADDVPDADYVGDVGERDPGIFAQGTLKHLSHIELDLESWYEKSEDDRRAQMYSPFHTEEDVGEVGENLTVPKDGDPGADEGSDGGDVPDLPTRDPDEEDYSDLAEQTAAEGTAETDGKPTLGHSQKAARARYDVDGDGDLEQPILRRDWDAIVVEDEAQAGYHFNIPMRFNESALSMFDANYNLEFTSLDGRIDHGPVETNEWEERNGIAPFMEATVRGHFLVPPITLRSLPHPQPVSVDIDVERDGGDVVVVVETDETESGTDRKRGKGNKKGKQNGKTKPEKGQKDRGGPNRIDNETVRFGAPEDVNRARGASPTGTDRRGGKLRYVFDADAVDVEEEAKLVAKRHGDRKPVAGSTTL